MYTATQGYLWVDVKTGAKRRITITAESETILYSSSMTAELYTPASESYSWKLPPALPRS